MTFCPILYYAPRLPLRWWERALMFVGVRVRPRYGPLVKYYYAQSGDSLYHLGEAELLIMPRDGGRPH